MLVEYQITRYACFLRLRPERDWTRHQLGKGEAHYRDVLRRWLIRLLERQQHPLVAGSEVFADLKTDYATGQRTVRVYIQVVRDVAPEHRSVVESLLRDPQIKSCIRVPVMMP